MGSFYLSLFSVLKYFLRVSHRTKSYVAKLPSNTG